MKKKFKNHNLWNSKDLSPPSMDFYKSKKKIVRIVRKAITGEFIANKYREILFREMVTLSRFADVRKRKYRSDKGFRAIQKVNKVVEGIHTVDLKTAVAVMKSNMAHSFVPSKQLCRWILVKLQSNALLLQQLRKYCSSAASRLYHRLRTGHNWIEVTMALSMISRIWAVSKLLLKISFVSYKKLLSVSDNLKTDPKDEDAEWLKIEFPQNLKKWTLLKVHGSCDLTL